MTDSSVPMTAFEQRLALQLRSASSVAVRSVDPVIVTRDARAARRGVVSFPRWPLFPQGLVRAAAIVVLILLLVATVALFVFGGLGKFEFVLPAPTNSPAPLQSILLPTVAPSTASPLPTIPATPSLEPVITPQATIATVQNPAFHLGQLAYTISPANDLFLANADGTNATKIATQAYNPVWYGDQLVYQDLSRRVSRWVARDTDGTLRNIGPAGGFWWWRISPDGRTFVLPHSDRVTVLFPDDSSRDFPPPQGYEGWDDGSDISSVSWFPDGSAFLMNACKVASTCARSPFEEHALFRVPVDGSDPVRLDSVGNEAAEALVSPDGTLIAYHSLCADCGKLTVMRADGTGIHSLVEPSAGFVTDLTFTWSADSSQISFAYEELVDGGGGRGVWIVDADGATPPVQIAPSEGALVTEESGNILPTGGYEIWGMSPEDASVLATGPAALPDSGLWSIQSSVAGRTQLAPGIYMAAWEWVPNN